MFLIILFSMWVFLAFLYSRYRGTVAKTRVEKWAKSNCFNIESIELIHISINDPFIFKRSSNQLTFRIQVRDCDGQIQAGWIRCGHWMFGLHIDRLSVQWDDPSWRDKRCQEPLTTPGRIKGVRNR